ncbi:hypothetical protein PCL_12116 [Purpureocillium lilacinum]|uniref:Sister chromatid cohesion protein n=1 Tax=Purpureocillium lilacinum TaxID=33203 RepID=A0A2U3DPF0_PURLI|nr:hypothetical protein PCL_12116 [Purpureocillium lilacinum]
MLESYGRVRRFFKPTKANVPPPRLVKIHTGNHPKTRNLRTRGAPTQPPQRRSESHKSHATAPATTGAIITSKRTLDPAPHVGTTGTDRLRDNTPNFELSTSQTDIQLPRPTRPKLPQSSGNGSIFNIELPQVNLERDEYLEISDAPDAPQDLTPRRQTAPDFADGPGVSITSLDQQQVANAALGTLDRLLQSIFAAVGHVLGQEDGFEDIVTLTADQEAVMNAAMHQEVHDAAQEVIRFDASLTNVDDLEVRPDKSWDQAAVMSWIQRLSDVETALRAARTCARILSGGRNDKQLYSESVINHCVDILNTVTEDVVIPLVELRNSGPSADLFKMVRRHKDEITSVFACCRELITVLAELVTKIELLDSATSGRVSTDGGSRAAFVRSMGGDEYVEYDESRTAEKGHGTATTPIEEPRAQNLANAIHDLESDTAPLAACASQTASYIINFMVKRVVGTINTGDTHYRRLLDLFVEDLTTCLDSPEWPSAELLLRLLMVTMVQLFDAPKMAAPARNIALELFGTMSAAISRLRSYVKKTASALEGSDAGELSQYLSDLATQLLEQDCQMEQIVAWSGPLRSTLEYLQGQCSKIPHLSSAVSFMIADWASKIDSAYYSFPEADREQQHELGRLAYRLRLTIDDKKRSSCEYTFKAVTRKQARFAFSILLLRSPLFQSFEKIFHVLLGSIASDQATIRSKSLKSVDQILETDPSILDGDSKVVQLILDCSSDSSTQVRDTALSVLGKCIGMRPSLEPLLSPKIVDRFQDAGVVVRKRAMKLACDIYLRNQDMGLRSAIANGLLRRVQDPDEGVQDLARQVIEKLWFAPFYAHESTAAVETALMEHVALIIQTVKTGTVAEVLDRVLRIIARPSNRSLKDPFVVLTIFAKADPKLFTLEQIRLLKPHLADFTGRDDLAAFRAATIICKRVLPQLQTAQSGFLVEVKLHLLRGMSKMPSRGALDDLIDCTRTVCELLNDTSPLANLVASSLLRIQELRGTPLDSKRLNHFCAYAIIVGSIARRCDLDAQLHIFRMKLPALQLTSVPRLIIDTLLPFALPPQSSKARQSAIEAIGLVCLSWPRNYLLAEVHTTFQQVFQDRNSVLETRVLRSFRGFLMAEEQRSEAGVAAAATGGRKQELTGMDGIGFYDVATAITQSFLNDISRIALDSHREHAFLALEVLGSIRRQGLTHPKDIGVTLITLETSANGKIAKFAFSEHRALHQKYETVLDREYVKAVQSAYNYQRDVVKDSHGATVGPFQSKLHLVMEVLKISPLKNRQRFLEKLCNQTDFELSKLDVTGQLPPHVGFARFVLENVAFFEYQTVGEIQTVVDTLGKIVTDTGATVAQAIESEIFNLRMNADKMSQPEDLNAAEPIAAMSTGDIAVAGPLGVAEFSVSALPAELRRLRQLATASMVLLSLWEACSYLCKLYNMSTDRRGATAKMPAKNLNKSPSTTQGVRKDKFWEALTSHMKGLQDRETMERTCRLIVELMNVDQDLNMAYEDNESGAPGVEQENNRPGRGQKRKASTAPGGARKRAQTSSRLRKRGRKHNSDTSDDEGSDGDWI